MPDRKDEGPPDNDKFKQRATVEGALVTGFVCILACGFLVLISVTVSRGLLFAAAFIERPLR